MNTSSKLSNLRRELVNEYLIERHYQLEFIRIYNEILILEGTPEKQLQIPEDEEQNAPREEYD